MQEPGIPDAGLAVQAQAVLALSHLGAAQRRFHIGADDRAMLGAEELFGAGAQQGRLRAAGQVGRRLVDLLHLQGLGVMQGDGQGGGLDDALQGGLGLLGLGLGLPPPLDVQQGIGELAPGFLQPGDHGIAHHPELAPVQTLEPAFEGLSLALGELIEVMGLVKGVRGVRRGHHADRLAREGTEVAAEHAACRAVHPLDAAAPHDDDADQHRVQHRALALGLQHQRLLRTPAVVNIDIGGDHAFVRGTGTHHTLIDLGPQAAAIAAAQAQLPIPLALAGQGLPDLRLQALVLEGRLEQLALGQSVELADAVAAHAGQGFVGARHLTLAQDGHAHIGEIEHQLPVLQQGFQLRLLGLEAADVADHEHGLVARALHLAQAQGQPARLVGLAPDLDELGLVARLAAELSQRFGHLPGQLGQGCKQGRHRGACRRADREPQHALEALVAAQQLLVAQIGHAHAGAVHDGGQLGQQLLVAALRLGLGRDVQGHHRGGALAAGELAGLHPGQQPASAQLGVAHGIANLDPVSVLERALQALELGQRVRFHHIAAHALQACQRALGLATTAAGPRAQPAGILLEGGQAHAGRVHQGIQLLVGQIALVLKAAVFQNGHEAP